jgi:hypothetical protein
MIACAAREIMINEELVQQEMKQVKSLPEHLATPLHASVS